MAIEDAVFWGSLVGLVVLILISYWKTRNIRQSGFLFFLLAVCGAIYAFVFQSGPHIQSKGISNEPTFVIILYGCMLLGIAFHYFYNLFSNVGPRSRRFDLRRFLAPVFASPIVFIPLLGAFQSAEVDLTSLTLPKLMVFFVAFENGFFWKELVDNRTAEHKP